MVSDGNFEDVRHNEDILAADNSIPNRPVKNMSEEEKEDFHPSNVLPELNCSAFFRTDESLETRDTCQAWFTSATSPLYSEKACKSGNSYQLQHADIMQKLPDAALQHRMADFGTVYNIRRNKYPGTSFHNGTGTAAIHIQHPIPCFVRFWRFEVRTFCPVHVLKDV